MLAVPTALAELLSFNLLLTLVAGISICTVCDVMEISHGGTLCYEKQTNTLKNTGDAKQSHNGSNEISLDVHIIKAYESTNLELL